MCEVVSTLAEFNKKGEPELEIQRVTFEEGLKNGDNVKDLKMDNMQEVRALLLSLTGNTELAASGEFVFASNPRKSRDTLINSL